MRFALFLLFYCVFICSADAQRKCEMPTDQTAGVISCHIRERLADVQTSYLSGKVVDPNDEGLPESVINVYETGEDERFVAMVMTDKNGRFCLKGLADGVYRVHIGWSRSGFNCFEVEVRIRKGSLHKINAKLPVGT